MELVVVSGLNYPLLKLPLSELPTFEIACFCSYSTPFEITPF
jgi:hypothetical protein